MKELNLTIDRNAFNLIWNGIHSKEKELLNIVKIYGEDSDEGADALNDLVYLRLYKESLEDQGKKTFDKNAFFITNEEL